LPLRKPSQRSHLSEATSVLPIYLGRYREAADRFSAAIQDSPDDLNFAESLADTYRRSNQPERAPPLTTTPSTTHSRLSKTNPKDTDALATLAGSYAKKGQDSQTLQFIRQTRQIDPALNELIYPEATVHAIARRWPEAVASRRGALLRGSLTDPIRRLNPLRHVFCEGWRETAKMRARNG
jgi:hypothetical protein